MGMLKLAQALGAGRADPGPALDGTSYPLVHYPPPTGFLIRLLSGSIVVPSTFQPSRDGTAGAGGMAPPASDRISARMKCAQGRFSPVTSTRVLIIGHFENPR